MKRSTHIGSINVLIRQFLKFQLWASAILLIGGWFGCGTPPVNLTPILDQPNMDKIYLEGREFGLSFGEKSSVAVSGIIDEDKLILLMLCVSHTERIDVIPEDISVLGYSVNNNRVSFEVYPPAEYMKKIRNAQSWNLALQALAGALDTQEAGRLASAGYGRYGRGSYYAEARKRRAIDRTLAKNKKELRETAESYAYINATTESGLLKSNTIFNHGAVGGIVIVKLLKSRSRKDRYIPYNQVYSRIVITVPWVKAEPHQITLAQ